jgi:hypothetical protein
VGNLVQRQRPLMQAPSLNERCYGQSLYELAERDESQKPSQPIWAFASLWPCRQSKIQVHHRAHTHNLHQ